MNNPTSNISVVVTSIAAPNRILRALADGCREHGQRFYVIGDVPSPSDFSLPGCDFFSLERQYESGFRIAREGPTRHYARKNVGYLQAIRDGAALIVETDDDNEPMPAFWRGRTLRHTAPVLSQAGWANVYRYFTDGEAVWPRGLPLTKVKGDLVPYEQCPAQEVACPIQQGLADENPDVDAIYRLVAPLPIRFRTGRKIALAGGVWCPFNSQNTAFFPEAYELLYLPAHCSFRMTDIWRSFVAQRILWENGWMLLFSDSTVVQERNDHDLMKDFRDEIPGYLHNETIARILEALPLKPGSSEIANNLAKCYEALVEAELFPNKELSLLDAWLDDLTAARHSGSKKTRTRGSALESALFFQLQAGFTGLVCHGRSGLLNPNKYLTWAAIVSAALGNADQPQGVVSLLQSGCINGNLETRLAQPGVLKVLHEVRPGGCNPAQSPPSDDHVHPVEGFPRLCV